MDQFEELQTTIDESVHEAQRRALKARRVVAAWNRAGLTPEDEESSGEEEDYSPKKGRNDLAAARLAISDRDKEIEELKKKVEEATKQTNLHKAENIHHAEQKEELALKLRKALERVAEDEETAEVL